MKKVIIRIIAAVMILAIVLSLAVTAFATETNSFNAGVTITEMDDGSICVAVSDDEETNAILAQEKPTLTVACSFENAYVTYGESVVESTLENGKITFTVAQGGEYYITEGEVPVQNVAKIGDVEYATLTDALGAAKIGETVVLKNDVTDGTILVYPGVTLDLSGYKLTVEYIAAFNTAHIIDSSQGSGRLDTEMNNLILQINNAQIPVYNGEAYIFTDFLYQLKEDEYYDDEGIRINALCTSKNMEVVKLFGDGAANNGIELSIRLSWDDGDGVRYQNFVFKDVTVAAVFDSNNGTWTDYGKMFVMTIKGIENVKNLKANMLVSSDTLAEVISTVTLEIN